MIKGLRKIRLIQIYIGNFNERASNF